MQLIIDTSNTKLSVRNKAFFIANESMSRIISPKRVDSIAITSHCNINAAAIKLAAQHQIPLYIYNNFGTLQARVCSPFLVNTADLRRKQLLFYHKPQATVWVIEMLYNKTILQIGLLKQLANRKPKYKVQISIAEKSMLQILSKTQELKQQNIDEVRGSLLGIEGSISRIYYKHLSLFVTPPFDFKARTRRPAMDYFNAGLNYLYGMTYSIVETGIYAKGLDPFSGFMHTDYPRKPSLVFDMIEPVRPLIDKMWIQHILNKQITEKHFIKKEQGYWLNKAGKRILIPAFNSYLKKRLKVDNTMYVLNNYIYHLSNDLGELIKRTMAK